MIAIKNAVSSCPSIDLDLDEVISILMLLPYAINVSNTVVTDLFN